MAAHLVGGVFQVPPHAIKVDGRGQPRELILPAGSLKVESFSAIPAGPARVAAQEAFLERCAKAVPPKRLNQELQPRFHARLALAVTVEESQRRSR